MRLRFTKMQGAGNDFIMINSVDAPFNLTASEIRALCDRQYGIGCDQMLVVEKSSLEGVDFKYRIFNQNGGEVEMCGNGARCFAVFVREEGLTDKRTIACETMKGIVRPHVEDDGTVTVDMGAPRFAPEDSGFVCEGLSKLTRAQDTLWQVKAAGGDRWVSVVSMGNPHAVMVVGDVKTAPVEEVGAAFQTLEVFQNRVNVGFLQIISETEAALRVYERGVGETLACGTGACAAVVTGIRRGALARDVRVHMNGGDLRIRWAGDGESVYLTGEARTVFTGEIDTQDAVLPASRA